MAETQTEQYRTRYRGRPSDVQLREDDAEERDDEDGMMSIRLPIASSGDVRNEGDEPLTRAELKGMTQQVESLQTGVFPDHGQSQILGGASQYSQFEKLGYWADGEIEAEAAADGEDLLMATARMPDPETLPAATGEYRQMLAILKEQAKRGIPIDASIGWREDDDSPGGVDLMEASMVGIGADPRTSTEGGEALARAAAHPGGDVAGFVERAKDILESGRDVTDEQNELALRLLSEFEESQGDATLSDFSEWLYSNGDDLDADEVTAARAVIDEYIEETTPWEDPVSETLRPYLSGDGDTMTDDDTAEDGGTTEQNADVDDESTDADTEPDAEGREDDGDEDDEERTCPECEHDVGTDANYCAECGEDLREDDEDGEDEEETNEDDEDDEEDDEEQDVNTSDADTSDGDASEAEADDLRSEIDGLRSDLDDVRSALADGDTDALDVDTEDDAEDADEQRDTDDTDPDPIDGLGEYA